MLQGKTIMVAFVALIIGLIGGFVLRPVIAPAQKAAIAAAAPAAAPVSSEARGTQYFMAHVDEARKIVAGCRDGSVRGAECATADEALVKVDAAERRKRFLGN
jgi:hypothetical protein